MGLLTWQDICKKYKDTWVAITEREQDAVGSLIRGHVAYAHPQRKMFYAHLKSHFPHGNLAVRYTGAVTVPLFAAR